MTSSNSAKNRLLESALELFAEHGYHGTSVRDISGMAGVNVSLISRYFHGKQGLYQTCFLHLYDQIEKNKAEIIELFYKQAFHILIPLAFDFALKNKHSLLLIQRALLFDHKEESAHKLLANFATSLKPVYPHMNHTQIQLGLQSLLILLTRYSIMSTKEKETLFGANESVLIIDHVCDLAKHIFSKDSP